MPFVVHSMSATLRTPYLAIAQRMQFLSSGILLVMAISWLACFYPFDDALDRQGTPLGADFSMFYVAGKVVSEGSGAQIYDQAEHQRQLHDLFPNLRPAFCLPYRYPPLVAWLVSPLARLPYSLAYLGFFGVSIITWIFAVRLLQQHSPLVQVTQRYGIGWSLAAWPVALEVLIGGQASMFANLIAVCSLLLVRHKRFVAAGLVLAFAAYKPNVLALLTVGIVFRYPRVLLGILPMALILGTTTFIVSGWKVSEEYIGLLTRLAGNEWDVATPFWKVHGLESWIALLLPGHSRWISVSIGLGLSVAVGIWWRVRCASESIAFTESAVLLLVINALFNPYTPIYDLVLLAPAIMFGAERFLIRSSDEEPTAVSAGAMQLVLATLFFAPHLSQSLAKIFGLQIFPIALLIIALWFLRKTLIASGQFDRIGGPFLGRRPFST